MIATAARPDTAVGGPRLTTTVAREYVHREALSEVFLTGSTPTAADAFTVSAQWPRDHSFFTTGHGLYDPMLLAETVRQTVPLLMHCEYGVPLGYHFGWTDFSFRVRPEAMRTTRAPAEPDLLITCHDVRRRGRLPVSMTMRIQVRWGGDVIGRAEMDVWSRAPEVYRRLRGKYADREEVFAAAPVPPPAVAGALVGRARTQDVVLSRETTSPRWRLRVDTCHPTFFDHPLDHVPGMLTLEAVRQAALAAVGGDGAALLTGIDVTFGRYVEFDTPCWVTAHPSQAGSPDSFAVDGEQNGKTVFSATAYLATPPVF
ncbi:MULTISPECIES: ScbA/BarX family gamma-butyrolactone biosynthesis protein [unclassified Streptomyces]|uniref:ScbA/BarX family gamma-butyrolactone biosynthesis protein n=1 Tax=unclassified Streptomyces TaxID=2593676 RepID=UPI0037F4BD16